MVEECSRSTLSQAPHPTFPHPFPLLHRPLRHHRHRTADSRQAQHEQPLSMERELQLQRRQMDEIYGQRRLQWRGMGRFEGLWKKMDNGCWRRMVVVLVEVWKIQRGGGDCSRKCFFFLFFVLFFFGCIALYCYCPILFLKHENIKS